MLSSMSTSAFIADWNDSPPVALPDRRTYQQRAIVIWPGLDRRRLRRTQGDPWRIARLVASRTSLSLEAILFLLMGPEIDGRGSVDNGEYGARGRIFRGPSSGLTPAPR